METKGIEKALMASFWGLWGTNTLVFLVLQFLANREKKSWLRSALLRYIRIKTSSQTEDYHIILILMFILG
jgi:hypothetical protein